jgi:hypothetical protein
MPAAAAAAAREGLEMYVLLGNCIAHWYIEYRLYQIGGRNTVSRQRTHTSIFALLARSLPGSHSANQAREHKYLFLKHQYHKILGRFQGNLDHIVVKNTRNNRFTKTLRANFTYYVTTREKTNPRTLLQYILSYRILVRTGFDTTISLLSIAMSYYIQTFFGEKHKKHILSGIYFTCFRCCTTVIPTAWLALSQAFW